MKTTLECTFVQKNKDLDIVVLQSKQGKIEITFPKEEGDKFFTAGQQYDVEFKKSSGIHLMKNDIAN